VLIQTIRATETSVAQFRLAMTWLHVTADDITVAAEGDFDLTTFPHMLDVAFVDGAAVILSTDTIARISRTGTVITIDLARELAGAFYQQILAANDARLLVTRYGWDRGGAVPRSFWAVDVIGATDLMASFSYDAPDEVQSIRTAGTSWYFGMNSALLVATPACGP
jgi:hypothetical protein